MKYWGTGNRNGCGHSNEQYIGSFAHEEFIPGSTKNWHSHNSLRREVLDVYVFSQYDGDAVCIRYGAEGSEYYSPGSLHQFIQTAGRHDHDMYARALKLILEKGTIKWERQHE